MYSNFETIPFLLITSFGAWNRLKKVDFCCIGNVKNSKSESERLRFVTFIIFKSDHDTKNC